MRARLSFLLGIIYALLVCTTFAQSAPSVTLISVDPQSTAAAELWTDAPNPTPTNPPSDTQTTLYTSVGTAVPPDGGGATCVQDCLAIAAAGAGCSSSVDVRCVCSSSSFPGLAQDCFGTSSCDSAAVARALGDQRVLCGAGTTTSLGKSSGAPSTTVAPTPPLTGSSDPTATGSRSLTITRQPTSTTLVLSSGAVLTLSGVRTTLTAGLTTVVGSTSGSGTSNGSNAKASNNGVGNRWNIAGSMIFLGYWIVF